MTARALRLRLVGYLVALALAGTGLTAFAVFGLVRQTFERQLRAELGRRLQGVVPLLQSQQAALGAALSELGNQLRQSPTETLQILFAGGAGAVEIAARLLPRTGLDLLEVLDVDGRTVSSSHAPELAGLPGAWSSLPPAETVLVANPSHSLPGLATVRREPLRVGNRSLFLVGGSLLDESFVRAVATGGAAVLRAPDDSWTITAGRGDELSPGSAPDSAWRAGPVELEGAGGTRWLAGARELTDFNGRPLGSLIIAVDREPLRALLGSLRAGLLAVVAGAGLMAALAGMWIAGRTARPVNELVRAIDSIAKGEADYTFTRHVEDEFEELVTAFSRLHRALELQRNRSRAAERVAAWREVARHVAHEVKNPLAPIRLTVENLLRAKRRAPEQFDEMFDGGVRTILEEVDRLTRLVGEFSEFARLPLPRRRPVDLQLLIDETLALYAAEPGLVVERRDDEGLPPIDLDPDQISRALKNVIGNAVDAMRESSPGDATKRLELRTAAEGDWLKLEIADRGAGFSAEAAEQIFEPYYTTKSEGTGLGMSISYRIITEHGGVISAENRPSGGARVVIRLPRSAVGAPRTAV